MEFFEVSVSHVRRQDFVAVVRSYAGMFFFVSLILSTIVKNKWNWFKITWFVFKSCKGVVVVTKVHFHDFSVTKLLQVKS